MNDFIYSAAILFLIMFLVSGIIFLSSAKSVKKYAEDADKRTKMMGRVAKVGLIMGILAVQLTIFVPLAIIVFVLDLMNVSNGIRLVVFILYFGLLIRSITKNRKKKKKEEPVENVD